MGGIESGTIESYPQNDIFIMKIYKSDKQFPKKNESVICNQSVIRGQIGSG